MSFVTGKIDIQLSVDVHPEFELVEPLQESCIWRQARGSATEISGMDDPQSIEKVLLRMETFFSLVWLFVFTHSQTWCRLGLHNSGTRNWIMWQL